MRHPSSLYRVGGSAIITGAVLMVAAVALRTDLPETLQAVADKPTAVWSFAFWCMAIGSLALLGGWIALDRHFHHSQVEGWTAVGLAGFIIGASGTALMAALNAEALPGLIDVYLQGGSSEVSAETSYVAMYGTVRAIELISWTFLWVGTALSSVSIAEDAAWASWLGYCGIAVGLVEIASLLLPEESFTHDVFAMVGFVWLGVVGYIFMRIEKELPYRATVPQNQGMGAIAAD
jgi:hypothetical protein